VRELGGDSKTQNQAERVDPVGAPLEPAQKAGSTSEGQVAVNVFPGATFECVRCGSRFSGEELAKLPELTCSNCGYRVFRKVRGGSAKTLKAE
jgi:DNA-directed RNA polymerase subunit RPC12/RpoP